MAIRKQHNEDHRTWFITFTCYNWMPLFDLANAYYTVYNWLNFIDVKYQAKTFAYVIMPNHVHLILFFPNEGFDLNKIISNAKRFMAYEIVKQLQEHKQNDLLYKLSSSCSTLEKAKGQKHKIFEPSFDAKPIFSRDFLHQKLDYIHFNPVRGKWRLSDEYTDYQHSSAGFYTDEKPNDFLAITDYREYWD